MFFAAFLTVASAAAPADRASGARKLNPAEQWVVKQVIAGEIADLEAALNADQTKKFPEQEDRKLGARFLEDLLTGTLPGVKPHRNGVRIQRAIIEKPIDLTNAQIPYEVWLDYCQFKDRVILRHANFANRVTFDKSTFTADANFAGVTVKLDASFHKSVFEGQVVFRAARIDGFSAQEAQFRNKAKSIYFEALEIGYIDIQKAVFEGPVDFSEATITRNLLADEAQFNNTEKGASFHGMKVGTIAAFSKAVFEGPVNFSGMDIASEFQADEAHFNNKKQGASFTGMKVGTIAAFSKAVFEGPVDFRLAKIAGNFQAGEAQFNDKEKGADFNSMQVGTIAAFSRAVFEGPVGFIDAAIDGDFQADEACFNDKTEGANFNSIKVRHVAVFSKAVFEGPVDFRLAKIAGNFQAHEAQFNDKEKGADFNSMKVGHAFFTKAVFEGPMILRGAEITGNFEALEAQFKDKEHLADFTRMKVGNAAFFKKAVFEGPVDFGAADIAGTFEGEETQFRSKTKTVQLMMRCGMSGVFIRTTFAGPVSFADSSFLDLMILHANAGASPISQIDLSRSSIKRQLSIESTRIHELVARSVHVEGPADFTDVIVEHSADLRDGDFAALDLSRSIWPKDKRDGATLQMQGINYKSICADADEFKSHKALLKLAGQSAFAADIYRNLEGFFLRRGYSTDADRVFIAGKRRERKEFLHGIRSFGSLLLDWLVCYGRRPWQAGYFCAFFVGLGFFLFSPRKMELQKTEGAPRTYNRFWYSFGLFLPVVNLEADKVWKPKPDQAFLRSYMRVHILLGWILIPILLAALTGLIK